jgi:hypothetical protein
VGGAKLNKMKAEFWENRIKEIVTNNDNESIKLVAKLIEEAEQAKQELRNKGYGWTGLSLLNTVLEEVPSVLANER